MVEGPDKRLVQAYEALKGVLSGDSLEELCVLMNAACQGLSVDRDVDVKEIAQAATREGDRYDCDRWWLQRFHDVVVARRTEACARLMEMSTPELLLAAGEMTERELLTVKAVLRRQAWAIRQLGAGT